jgi:deoxyribodipyrimidine photolyase-related protein
MSNINTALILYPNQLFDIKYLPKVDVIYMVEEPLFFGLDPDRRLQFHRQKLLLHRASMRRYVEEYLWQNDVDVEYIELKSIEEPADVLVAAQKAGAQQVMIFDVNDHLLESKLKKAVDQRLENPFELKVLPSPSFMLKSLEAKEFFNKTRKHQFSDFYQWQRERFNVLIDASYKPIGGKWVFENQTTQALPDSSVSPSFSAFGDNQYVKQSKDWVNNHFKDNPGDINNFFWPTDHSEAVKWLDDFLKNRFEMFADYTKTLDNNSVLLYNSGISAMLNTGLLTPVQVINEAIKYSSKNQIKLECLEGFVRRIIGWREYVRGLYIAGVVETHKVKGQKLSSKWWDASVGLPPIDDVIGKINKHGYASSSERALACNLMILTGVEPIEIYKWFISQFIDSYDWVVQPNVFGASSLSDLGGMITQPYISDSSYILKNSDYKKDLWCDTWDGLFWEYVDHHRAALASNVLTANLVKNLDKITTEHRRIISYRAQDFLSVL